MSWRWKGLDSFQQVLGRVLDSMQPGGYQWEYRIVCADDDGAVTLMKGGGQLHEETAADPLDFLGEPWI